jgi:hypothetical protein
MATTTSPARSRSFSRPVLVRIGRSKALAAETEGRLLPAASFHCECDGARCRERLSLSLDDYHRLRGHRGWVVVSPGHQVIGTVFEARLGCGFVLRQP